MDDIAEENQNHAQTKEVTLVGENAPLQCIFPGCLEKQAFSTRSALK
jgi:hypothetical protein